jgi:threonine/homoserine/homoserine lactone efflux protein
VRVRLSARRDIGEFLIARHSTARLRVNPNPASIVVAWARASARVRLVHALVAPRNCRAASRPADRETSAVSYIPNPLIIPVGILIGILVAAPVGPVNVLCIQRAIERGFWGGVAAGLGAVLGDGLIALFAAMGVGAISGAVKDYRFAIQVVGGLALIGFGVKLFFTQPKLEALHAGHGEEATLGDFVWDIPQTFFLTITNPGAVLGLFAIFGGISTFVEVSSRLDALTLVAATMGGSLLWWLWLSRAIGRIRHHLNERRLQQINQYGGIALVVFGVLLIGEIALKLARVL